VGLYGDALRHSDGSFTKAYHIEMSPTVLSDDLVIESRCDALARMLAARKPVGLNNHDIVRTFSITTSCAL
jgi:hypothetical protein